jgi:hypothetical protein
VPYWQSGTAVFVAIVDVDVVVGVVVIVVFGDGIPVDNCIDGRLV